MRDNEIHTYNAIHRNAYTNVIHYTVFLGDAVPPTHLLQRKCNLIDVIFKTVQLNVMMQYIQTPNAVDAAPTSTSTAKSISFSSHPTPNAPTNISKMQIAPDANQS